MPSQGSRSSVIVRLAYPSSAGVSGAVTTCCSSINKLREQGLRIQFGQTCVTRIAMTRIHNSRQELYLVTQDILLEARVVFKSMLAGSENTSHCARCTMTLRKSRKWESHTRLRWLGHLARMLDKRLPTRVFFGHIWHVDGSGLSWSH